jgi:hypothetical protein
VTWLRIVFAAAAWVYLAGVVIQVFLAGASLFELTDWTVHAGLGWGLGSAPIILLVLALGARVDRRTAWLTAGLTIAALAQPELAAARHDSPVLAAFHPVNALLVFWLAWVVASRATTNARQAPSRASRLAAVSTPDGPPGGGAV